MLSLKVLSKDSVVTCGSGSRRAVLDFSSGLIYAYAEPEKVLASYENGGWIMPKRPKYSSGGWGRGASGDPDGGHLWENARELLSSIEAKVRSINVSALISNEEFTRLLELSKKADALEKAVKRLGVSHEIEIGFRKTERLKIETISGARYDRDRNEYPHGFKGCDPIKVLESFEKAVQTFLTGKGKESKVETYQIGRNRITQDKTVVAFRDTKGSIFMNSQVLSVSPFERRFLGGQSIVQKAVREISNFNVPFNVLEAASLKLEDTTVLENGPEQTFTLKNEEKRHFTGALLLENAGRKFLMDVDRVEIENRIFNAFFVEVSSSVSSISEAYESMKPEEVRQAERDEVETKRQGEWFFIKTGKTVTVPVEKVLQRSQDGVTGPQIQRFDVSHGKGRPNSLFRPVNFDTETDSLVCGVVSHSGREHGDLNLGITDETGKKLSSVERNYRSFQEQDGEPKTRTFDLWKLVPNTTVSNFTITGDVD